MSPKNSPPPAWNLLRNPPPPPTMPELHDLLATLTDEARRDVLKTYISQTEETRRLSITQEHNTRRARNENSHFWAVPILGIIASGIVLIGITIAWHDAYVSKYAPPASAASASASK